MTGSGGHLNREYMKKNLILIRGLFLWVFQYKGVLYYVDRMNVGFYTIGKGVFSYVFKDQPKVTKGIEGP